MASGLSNGQHVDEAIDALYAAAVGQSSWPGALERLRCLVGASGAHINVMDRLTGDSAKLHWTGAYDTVALHKAGDLVHRGDPWTQAGLSILRGLPLKPWMSIAQGAELIPTREFKASAFYSEVMRYIQVDDFLAVSVTPDGRYAYSIAFNNGENSGIFSEHQRELLQKISKDVMRAFYIRHHWETAMSAKSAVGRALLDGALPCLVAADQVLVECNSAALELLAQGTVMRLSVNRRVKFADPALQDAFESISKPIALRSTGRRTITWIAGDFGVPRWLIQLVRIDTGGESLLAAVHGWTTIVCIVTPLDNDGRRSPIQFDGYRDFTPSELKILSLLAEGRRPKEIAVHLRRSIETVRWHIKNVMEKGGFRSLGDIYRLSAKLV